MTAEPLYSQKEWAQFRGPTTSENYNARVENLYKDLVTLKNKIGLLGENVNLDRRRFFKDIYMATMTFNALSERITDLEASQSVITFHDPGKVDINRFNGTDYEISTADRCSSDRNYNMIVLPRIESSSISKLRFSTEDGRTVIPPSLEAYVVGDSTSADTTSAFIDTNDVLNAIRTEPGRVWERNVVVDSSNPNGAVMDLYMRLPDDYSLNSDSNLITLHPYPIFGVDILDISYTTIASPTLTESDSYITLNVNDYYFEDDDAVGWLPPGAWAGDEIINSGLKAFHFDPKDITAIRITMRQRNYFIEKSKYVYSYGLAGIDVRYDKYYDEGKTIIRFDAPSGYTINSVTGVTPEVWNVSEAELDDVVQTRVIWETSYNSGVYTLTPVPGSSRVWVEVTLSKTLGKGTPALSGLRITGDIVGT